MAKKKTAKKKQTPKIAKARKGPRRLASHERVQHRPEPTADALPDKPLDLGPVLLPTPDRAVAVLAELADLNDRALQAHKAYLERQAAAKKAKETWDDLAKQVQEKLRLATHGSGLPLFDADEAEADRARMVDGALQEPISAPIDAPTDPEAGTNAESLSGLATGTEDEVAF